MAETQLSDCMVQSQIKSKMKQYKERGSASPYSRPQLQLPILLLYICVCVEMVDCGESDKMIKISEKMDKSHLQKVL